MNTTIPFGRDCSLNHALDLSTKTLQTYQLSMELTEIKRSGSLPTFLCIVNHPHLKLAFRGAGSGHTDEAKIRAICEAIEDSLFYAAMSNPSHSAIHFFSTKTCPTLNKLKEMELLPKNFFTPDIYTNSFPWLVLNNLENVNNVYYPLSLIFPHTHHINLYNDHVEQKSLTDFANTTGLAIGANSNEAIIHGILDWIERDAYGIFLLCCVISNKQCVKVIRKNTLPENLQNEICMIESHHQDELIIFDITTDINIPAFFVSFTQQPVPVQPSGLSASLCKTTALSAALHEALQACERYNDNTIQARQTTIKSYEAFPHLLQAFICDCDQLLSRGSVLHITWEDISSFHQIQALDLQINFLAMTLKKHAIEIYTQILSLTPGGLTLCYVLLTGVETFGTMREGIFTPVKRRGRRLLGG